MHSPQHKPSRTVAVLGAGSWGTALALSCAQVPNQQVYLWGHRAEHVAQLQSDRANQRYLPGYAFPDNLIVTQTLSIIRDVDMVLLVVPSSAFAELLVAIKPFISNQAIGWAIKGFDKDSNDLLSTTFRAHFPHNDYAIIAGPSFAKEVAAGLHTAITIASEKIDFASDFAQFLHHRTMRTYLSDDVIGTQLGGALKNVMAIATGIADGLGVGANARAALITRGLREITRISEKSGASSDTLMGLSGLGDLLLTCTDDLSRNRRLGLLLGQGKSLDEALAIIGQTVEGVFTAQEARRYAKTQGVHAPVIETIADILTGQQSIAEAMQSLLQHSPKLEAD